MISHIAKALLLSQVILTPTSLAQDCSALAVDHQGTIADGGTLSIDVSDGSPDAIVLMAVGRELAQTCVPVDPMGMNEVCVDVDLTQALVLPVGASDAMGDLSLVIELPPGPSGVMIEGEDLHFQAVSLVIDTSSMIPSIEACVSNVSTVTID
jgi:hypothetical protein